MRFRWLVISAAFAVGLAALPLSVARATLSAILPALLVASPDLALLRRGCRRRPRRDDCDPASSSAYRSATLLLRLLRAALLPATALLPTKILSASL